MKGLHLTSICYHIFCHSEDVPELLGATHGYTPCAFCTYALMGLIPTNLPCHSELIDRSNSPYGGYSVVLSYSWVFTQRIGNCVVDNLPWCWVCHFLSRAWRLWNPTVSDDCESIPFYTATRYAYVMCHKSSHDFLMLVPCPQLYLIFIHYCINIRLIYRQISLPISAPSSEISMHVD